jgi:formylglycine-generating enzyme required for sulfatase activity/transcriptional regulator with XRE-family HTH domain
VRRGLSQEVLARRIGCDVRTLRRLEQGKTQPQPATLKALADALGVEVAALLEGEPSEAPAAASAPVASAPPPAAAGRVGDLLTSAREAVAAGRELAPQVRDALLRHSPRTLDEYRLSRIAAWSQPRYALDKRFTRLTVLLDQGRDAEGARWQPAKSCSDLWEVVTERPGSEPAIVLLGNPGCGKSTLLRHLELERAIEALLRPEREARVTLFLPLSRYRATGGPLPPPGEWLAAEWRRLCPELPDFDAQLASGQLVLLLDAVNEMPHGSRADYEERVALWQAWLAQVADGSPGTRIVFSCRSLDYSAPLSVPELPVPQVRIERLSDAQVSEFLALHDARRGPVLARQLIGTPQLDLFRSPFYLKLLLGQLRDESDVLQGRAALFTGFVRAALLRELEKRTPELADPGVIAELDQQRILRGTWSRPHDLAPRSVLPRALGRLAAGLQEAHAGTDLSEVRASYDEALDLLEGEQPERLLAAGVAIQLLDRDESSDEVFFVHQLLQEYFAARDVCGAPQTARVRTPWRASELAPSLVELLAQLGDSEPLPPAPATGWEETFQLAAAMVDDATAFVAELAEHNLPLAGVSAAQPDVQISSELRRRLQGELLARSRDPAADLRARIAAARALAELGDPRLERAKGPEGEHLLPRFVAIEAGGYAIGDDEGLEPDEVPQHRVRLDAFAIAQRPVTNAEYRLFIEAHGYEDERWWSGESARAWRRGEGTAESPKQGWREQRRTLREQPGRLEELQRSGQLTSRMVELWRGYLQASDEEFERVLEQTFPSGRQVQPRFWNDPALSHASQPVVGVSWFEASAYCAWLSAQGAGSFRLPSEVEWEAAARGREGRRYAWGASLGAERCNTFESHVRATTPPGVFPAGDTPEGLMDMSGNVWEWTSTRYRPYSVEHGGNAAAHLVMRGGSWAYPSGNARCARRFSGPADDHDHSLGFRLVRSFPVLTS